MGIAQLARRNERRGRVRGPGRRGRGPQDASRALDVAHPGCIEDLHGAFEGTLHAFGQALELRGYVASGHTGRVAAWAEVLGRDIGLDAAALRALRWGAFLHDVGMLALPDRIAVRGDAQAEAGRRTLCEHTLYGVELLREVPGLPRETLEVVRSHHERWDGSGYPEGLGGEEIPLAARVFALADAYDEAAGEPSAGSRSRQEAVAALRSGSGRRFDPHLCARFLGLIEDPYSRTA